MLLIPLYFAITCILLTFNIVEGVQVTVYWRDWTKSFGWFEAASYNELKSKIKSSKVFPKELVGEYKLFVGQEIISDANFSVIAAQQANRINAMLSGETPVSLMLISVEHPSNPQQKIDIVIDKTRSVALLWTVITAKTGLSTVNPNNSRAYVIIRRGSRGEERLDDPYDILEDYDLPAEVDVQLRQYSTLNPPQRPTRCARITTKVNNRNYGIEVGHNETVGDFMNKIQAMFGVNFVHSVTHDLVNLLVHTRPSPPPASDPFVIAGREVMLANYPITRQSVIEVRPNNSNNRPPRIMFYPNRGKLMLTVNVDLGVNLQRYSMAVAPNCTTQELLEGARFLLGLDGNSSDIHLRYKIIHNGFDNVVQQSFSVELTIGPVFLAQSGLGEQSTLQISPRGPNDPAPNPKNLNRHVKFFPKTSY